MGVHIYSSVSRGLWGGEGWGGDSATPPQQGLTPLPPPHLPVLDHRSKTWKKGLRMSALWFQFCLRRRVSQEPTGAGPGQRGGGVFQRFPGLPLVSSSSSSSGGYGRWNLQTGSRVRRRLQNQNTTVCLVPEGLGGVWGGGGSDRV